MAYTTDRDSEGNVTFTYSDGTKKTYYSGGGTSTPAEQPKGSYEVTKADGTKVYRISGRNAQGTYVHDTNVTRYTDSSGRTSIGENKFITKTQTQTAQDQPVYIADNTGTIQNMDSGYFKRTQALAEREAKINKANQSIFNYLHIQKNETDNYVKGFFKAVARKPAEITTGAFIVGGRIVWAGESLFNKEGRAELKKGFSRVPGALIKAYDPRQPEGLVNIGLTALSVRSVAKSPGNLGAKAYHKYLAKTNIKGSISGSQGTTVYKGSGVYKGSKIKEVTVSADAGKTSTSTINYKGNTYIIDRGAKTTSFKVLKGDKVINKGTYQTPQNSLKPVLNSKTSTTQIKTLVQDPSRSFSSLDLETITNAKFSDFSIKSTKTRYSQENIGLQSKTTQKYGGVVSDQKIIQTSPGKFLIEKNKPTIQVSSKPNVLKDSITVKTVPGGKETTIISQPKTFLKGTEITTIKGEYSFIDVPKGWGKLGSVTTRPTLETQPVVSVTTPPTSSTTSLFTIDRTALSIPTTKGGIIPIFNFESKPEYNIKTKSAVTPSIYDVNIVSTKIYEDNKPKTSIFTGSASKPAEIITSKPITQSKQQQIVNPVQETVNFQAPEYTVTQATTIRTRRSITPPVFNPPPQRPVNPVITNLPGFKNVYAKSTGFDVFVRSKGVFNKINIKPLAKSEAVNLGAFRVGMSASATFKVSPSSEAVGERFGQKGFLSDFYKKDNLFIEKRSRRIKSPGEKREITYKGIMSLKRRRHKK